MTNIVEAILERKLIQLQALQREIDALRLAAKLVKQESPATNPKSHPPRVTAAKPSRTELNRQRTEQVIAILTDAKGQEVHAGALAKAFGVSDESIKDWMLLRLQKYGDRCPWVLGRNSYWFKLRVTTPDDLAFLHE